MRLAALDDFDDPTPGASSGFCQARSLVACIGEDALDEREEAAGAVIENQPCAIAILDIGGMHDNVQEQAERVDEDVPLAARNLLARIKALRVECRAPFCAALALWLSMIAAEGLASLPSRSRVAT